MFGVLGSSAAAADTEPTAVVSCGFEWLRASSAKVWLGASMSMASEQNLRMRSMAPGEWFWTPLATLLLEKESLGQNG